MGCKPQIQRDIAHMIDDSRNFQERVQEAILSAEAEGFYGTAEALRLLQDSTRVFTPTLDHLNVPDREFTSRFAVHWRRP